MLVVPLTESRSRRFPSGGKISVWVIQEIWSECFSTHSALKLCGYMQERGPRLERWKYLSVSFISKASLHFTYQCCPQPQFGRRFCWECFHTVVHCPDLCSSCSWMVNWSTFWFLVLPRRQGVENQGVTGWNNEFLSKLWNLCLVNPSASVYLSIKLCVMSSWLIGA